MSMGYAVARDLRPLPRLQSTTWGTDQKRGCTPGAWLRIGCVGAEAVASVSSVACSGIALAFWAGEGCAGSGEDEPLPPRMISDGSRPS